MPYNTRRKSLSLSDLGVHVPKRARAPDHPLAASSPVVDDVKDSVEPPLKKARCVPQFVNTPAPSSPLKSAPIQIKTEDIQSQVLPGTENTPPPSPGSVKAKVSVDGIKDEVVVGAILQLEKTGNRPHTSKELAAALALCVPTITSSTNPNALIQARLATYLRGPWPLMSPCPIGKEQENIHPRRVFYFLTCMPHQPIPDTSLQQQQQQQQARRIISPSLSDEEVEAKYMRERTQLSPSPEVDLSSPELDEENDAELASMYSSRSSLSHSVSSLAHNRRAASPPLEREERDFKQTANQLQQQRRDSQRKSRQASEASVKADEANGRASPMSIDHEDNDDTLTTNTKEESIDLFGNHDQLASAYDLSSPVLRPQFPVSIDATMTAARIPSDKDHATTKVAETTSTAMDRDEPMNQWADWEQIQVPEEIELDELEDLFDAY